MYLLKSQMNTWSLVLITFLLCELFSINGTPKPRRKLQLHFWPCDTQGKTSQRWSGGWGGQARDSIFPPVSEQLQNFCQILALLPRSRTIPKLPISWGIYIIACLPDTPNRKEQLLHVFTRKVIFPICISLKKNTLLSQPFMFKVTLLGYSLHSVSNNLLVLLIFTLQRTLLLTTASIFIPGVATVFRALLFASIHSMALIRHLLGHHTLGSSQSVSLWVTALRRAPPLTDWCTWMVCSPFL